ncbi:MAG: glycoside hydrolase family 130 protein [Planctomycetales bacterium]|nr:glycoside hydrolase family 130 protein [Planctomycetales bacterium]MCA9166373.1 glycoside hydrolase family 130 protein [Planctomycetales bacterium]
MVERVIRRISEAVLLCPRDLQPYGDEFRVIGVFNPGAVRFNHQTVLLSRVAEAPRELRLGFAGLPRWESNGKVVTDWVAEDELDCTDPRVVRQKSDGAQRLTSVSHLRVFRGPSQGNTTWTPGPLLLPTSPMEEFGIEDARITEIDGTFWITYVAVSRQGVATALASTHDFETFERHGVVFCPENKDVVLFPQRFDGEYVALHRPNPNSRFGPPEIWIARSHNLLQWGQHAPLYRGSCAWESDRVGAGTQPVLLEEGWLVLYHGCRTTPTGGIGAYSAGAMLLDRQNPSRILRRSHEPVMLPTSAFEQFGFVDNVVFPTAVIHSGDSLSVFYGAADTCTGVVEFSEREMLAALR